MIHTLILPILLASEPPTAARLLDSLEQQSRLRSDATATVRLTQTKAGQGARAFALRWFRRDSDESFVILMDAPEAERGNGYLRSGDHFWMYRRNTRTFQHVNRDESIGGTDARGDDFETRKLTELYAQADGKAGMPVSDTLGKVPAWRFEVKAKVRDVDYPRKVYWVSRDGWQLLKEQAWSSTGTLMQTAYYLKYQPVEGRLVATRMLFVDEFEKGNRTMVEVDQIRTDKIPDAHFTKAWLESQSK
ncbi:MAG: outer membrane lipoprotein-sorting protein [Fibrobacteria bacterium]|nr:outer membrane lipoprotein-sorting protein [Fibrobacteria bacterium]